MIFTESAKTRDWKKSILRAEVEKNYSLEELQHRMRLVGDSKVLPLGTAPFYFLLIHCLPKPGSTTNFILSLLVDEDRIFAVHLVSKALSS